MKQFLFSLAILSSLCGFALLPPIQIPPVQFVNVLPQFKNLSIETFPTKNQSPDFLTHLVDAFDSDTVAHELGHNLAACHDPGMGEKVIQDTISGKFQIAQEGFKTIVLQLGSATSPMNVSRFNECIQREIVLRVLPNIAYLANQFANTRSMLQKNESDISLLKKILGACGNQNCTSDVLTGLRSGIASKTAQQNELSKEGDLQFLALQSAVQNEGRRFETLSNASKARHDIALNSIRNIK
jgi:hypothetical protein